MENIAIANTIWGPADEKGLIWIDSDTCITIEAAKEAFDNYLALQGKEKGADEAATRA